LALHWRVRQRAAPTSGFQVRVSVRHPAPCRDQRAASRVRQQVALPREEFLPVLSAAQQAVAQQAVLPFAAVRVRILVRVPAARRPVAELAVQVAWPNAEQLSEAPRAAAAQPAVLPFAAVRALFPFRAPAAARRPVAELAVQVASLNAEPGVEAAQPDAVAAAEAVQPGAVAEAEVAQPDVVEALEAV
jgi:hypothetical protein